MENRNRAYVVHSQDGTFLGYVAATSMERARSIAARKVWRRGRFGFGTIETAGTAALTIDPWLSPQMRALIIAQGA